MQTTEIPAELGEIDTSSVESIENTIKNLTTDILIEAGVDTSAVDDFIEEEHKSDGKVEWDNFTYKVDRYKSMVQHAKGWIIWDNDERYVKTRFEAEGKIRLRWDKSGAPVAASSVSGTAHASGTANAGGNWGTATGGKTLVGELGKEIIVDSRTGKWYTVGDHGAEFVDVPPGAIVFNHIQAMDSLEETQYDRYVSEQKELLSNLYDEYERVLNERLDNVDALISDMINSVNANSSTICSTLASETKKVGYTITENESAIWSNDGGASAIITKYGDSFLSQLTSVNDVILKIATKVGAMATESDAQASATVTGTPTAASTATSSKPSTTSAASTSSKKTSSKSTSAKKTSSKTDAKKADESKNKKSQSNNSVSAK